MTQLAQVDTGIGDCTFAVNLVAIPPPSVRGSLGTIQDRLERRFPGNVLFSCPSASLYLSVFQFVWARSGETQTSAGSCTRRCEGVISGLGRIAGLTRGFVLGAPSIYATPAAVIARFAPSDALENLRDQVSAVADQAGLNWNRLGIQHLSIFRDRQPVVLQEMITACGAIPPPEITWQVRALRLVRENVYPSLNVSKIQDYELR